MDPYIQFNEQADDFLVKMIKTFPDEPKTKEVKFYFDHIRKINSRKPIELFMDSLKPYGLQIMAKDEYFFKNDQYVDAVESMSGKLGLIEYWDKLPKETKDAIWHYFQVLYVLGMKSLGLKDELTEILRKIHNNEYTFHA